MPFRDDEKERFYGTVWNIAKSSRVQTYIIGFTSKSLRERFRPYRYNEYEHMVILCDKLNQADALALEKFLFLAIKDAKKIREDRHVYDKYDPKRRLGPYRGSSGGTSVNAESPIHSVYMVWWAP
jgi:hypothetical protein